MSNTTKTPSIKSINPFNNEVVKEFELMSPEKVASIIDKADQAFKSWKNTSIEERATIMHKMATLMRDKKEDLGKLATLEMGKVLAQAIGEVKICAAIFDYYADNAAEFLADKPLEVPHVEAFLSY
jgi:succinate-semialdehyde dehydrogenase/glutarate-semialdehyde dehydrogenase